MMTMMTKTSQTSTTQAVGKGEDHIQFPPSSILSCLSLLRCFSEPGCEKTIFVWCCPSPVLLRLGLFQSLHALQFRWPSFAEISFILCSTSETRVTTGSLHHTTPSRHTKPDSYLTHTHSKLSLHRTVSLQCHFHTHHPHPLMMMMISQRYDGSRPQKA